MFIEYNVNPENKAVGDCVIRALTKALSMTWEEVYLALCLQGYKMCDMPSSNAVWGAFLRSKGFKRDIISSSCPAVLFRLKTKRQQGITRQPPAFQ